MDIERVVQELRRIQDGANVHTINKAVTYLRYLEGEDLERHTRNCLVVISGGLVSVFAYSMRRWQ